MGKSCEYPGALWASHVSILVHCGLGVGQSIVSVVLRLVIYMFSGTAREFYMPCCSPFPPMTKFSFQE